MRGWEKDDTGLQIIKPERERPPELRRSTSGQRRKGGGRKTFVSRFSFSFWGQARVASVMAMSEAGREGKAKH